MPEKIFLRFGKLAEVELIEWKVVSQRQPKYTRDDPGNNRVPDYILVGFSDSEYVATFHSRGDILAWLGDLPSRDGPTNIRVTWATTNPRRRVVRELTGHFWIKQYSRLTGSARPALAVSLFQADGPTGQEQDQAWRNRPGG